MVIIVLINKNKIKLESTFLKTKKICKCTDGDDDDCECYNRKYPNIKVINGTIEFGNFF